MHVNVLQFIFLSFRLYLVLWIRDYCRRNLSLSQHVCCWHEMCTVICVAPFFCCDCHVCRHHRDRCLWLVCSSCTARLTAVKTNNPGVHFQETVLCSLYALCTVHSITVGMIRAVSHWHGVSVNF